MGIKAKAQLDVQFHWVFILIIGAIILSFFVGIAVWYKNIQQQKITAESVVTIDAIMNMAQESPKTAQTISLPDITLEFSCEADDCSGYGCPSDFSSGGISRATETNALFTMKSLAGNMLITWALEWDMPYKIANFLYATTDSIRYILIYDEEHDNIAYIVNGLLAENSFLTKDMIKIEDTGGLELTNKNDAFVRIVAFLKQGSLQETLFEEVFGEKGKSWDIIYVDGTEESGDVYYNNGYSKGYNEPVQYIGLPLLVGAIFSQDSDFYNCNAKKAFIQGKLVSEVYLERTKILYEEISKIAEKEHCIYYYDTDIQEAIQDIGEEFGTATPSISVLSSSASLLEENNKYAVLKGCPRVY